MLMIKLNRDLSRSRAIFKWHPHYDASHYESDGRDKSSSPNKTYAYHKTDQANLTWQQRVEFLLIDYSVHH